MSLTYVSAFMKIYEAEVVIGRSFEYRLENAKKLLDAKIPLVLYISPCYLEAIQALYPDRPFTEYRVMDLSDTETYQLLKPFEHKCPTNRHLEKDTFEFMALMNAKTEFIANVIRTNPFETGSFAWVDFSIFHVLKNTERSTQLLESLCHTLPNQPLTIPGCWNRCLPNKDNVSWRFSGGFFIGSAAACLQFYELHKKYLTSAFDGCSWEVNYWAYLEENEPGFPITWFKGQHDDSILEIPESLFHSAQWLTKKATKSGAYTYPLLNQYTPSSSSFLEFRGQQLLNVRYVNYRQTPEGLYIIHDSHNRLKTENALVRLKGYEEVDQIDFMTVQTSLEQTNESIQGLEDLRLYECAGQLRFIATQCQWSPSCQNRMVLGSVDLSSNTYRDLQIVEPPTPTRCEKNWIPMVRDGTEYFIYQWHPLQIGLLKEGKLSIVQTHATDKVFERVRGSTIFHETEEGLLGVVHYSEEYRPRHYYHMLVLLDKETWAPIGWSKPFVFGRLGIEFCIGFAIRGSEYQFWYSQHDRDPVWLVIPRTDIPVRRTVPS